MSDNPDVEQLFTAVFDTLEAVTNRLDRIEQNTTSSATRDEGEAVGSDVAPLEEWVPWLSTTYGLGEKIPERWAEIPGVPQELDALRMAWASAYAEDGPVEGFGAGQWHDMLARVLGRLHDTWIADDRKRKHVGGRATVEPTVKLVPVAAVESSMEPRGEALASNDYDSREARRAREEAMRAAGADEETIRARKITDAFNARDPRQAASAAGRSEPPAARAIRPKNSSVRGRERGR